MANKRTVRLCASLVSTTCAAAAPSTQTVVQVPSIPIQARGLASHWSGRADYLVGTDLGSAREAMHAHLLQALTGLGYAAHAVDSFRVPRHSLLDVGRYVSADEAMAAGEALMRSCCANHADPDAPAYSAFTPDDPRSGLARSLILTSTRSFT